MLWGKIIGALFGALLFTPFKLPLLGAIFGIILGNRFDRGLERWVNHFAVFSAAGLGPAQETFFLITFATIGHLAKSDGRVSPQEIQHAALLLDHLRLTGARRKAAQDAFRTGMDSNYDVLGGITRLREACRGNVIILQLFWDIVQQAAASDGLTAGKRKILQQIAEQLGVQAHNPFGAEFAWQFGQRAYSGQQHGRRRRQAYTHGTTSLQDAYTILGLTAQASNDEIKKSYRRLMRQHHPDKLIAKGLPEDMIKLATEKTQNIRAAYELLKNDRGF